MSLRAPFIAKQYLSTDVESGSYSRIFWFYPLDQEKIHQGGIGLFFEVLSGDVGNDIYEQLTKRFWESFSDNFYAEDFETSLKKSIRTFIQLLQNSNVEEGVDVNIVLLNVTEAEKGYLLRLIRFGDSDVFVVRNGKFADMAKMIPENETLFDLKFLEVELDLNDVVLLGNKTLLRNAFEANLLEMESVEALLESLELFKDNLFGSKKLFVIAATEGEEKVSASLQKKTALLSHFAKEAGALGSLLVAKTKALLEQVTERIKKGKSTSLLQSALPPEEVSSQHDAAEDRVLKDSTEEVNTRVEEDPLVEFAEEKGLPEEDDKGYIKPPPVMSSQDEFTEEEKPSDEEHLIDPEISLPGKGITVDDFVVAEEITPGMVVEKSAYKGIVDEAQEGIPLSSQETVSSVVQPPSLPTRGRDYVQELRARHSLWGKIVRHPVTKAISGVLVGALLLGYQNVLKLFGKDYASMVPKKVFLSRPTLLEKKKIQPGVILIVVLVVVILFFWIRGNIRQRNLEAELLATYQEQVGTFSKFFEQNIAVIDTEDTERQLEFCRPEADKVYKKEAEVLPRIKSVEMKEQISVLTSQVQAKVSECEATFDRIYGIVRVKEAELVTDFRVSLGNDSDISSITFRGTSIVVADKGRNAIYQLNVENKSVMKLEDPLGLVVDPITVGTGEGTLFVCDKENGVLYFSNNASGGASGFNRIVGAEPGTIGECLYVDGYAKNAYVVPTSANVVYKITAKPGGGFETPTRYLTDLLGVRTISIDGFIYTIATIEGKGEIKRFYGPKQDAFAIPQSAELGEIGPSYTNPSNERNLYVYDKTKHAVLSIEKPNSRHPGRGVVEKTFQFDKNDDRFSDIKSIAIDVNSRNQEVYLYILSGTTIWRVKL
ncbi:MAG: hypothetical protein QY312_02235 [Candidatus Dojkabacteria bacterium]|nr:MAG: hypothetical protein QY312_02235 [Candidatus Dojkabacteria bacterium]